MNHATTAVLSHPVARALERRRIEQTVLDFSIRLHLLAEREFVRDDALAVARALMVGLELLEAAGQADSADARVIGGAISAIAQLEQRRWLWRRLDANAIDAGLQRAAGQAKNATGDQLRRAWQQVMAKSREPSGGMA